MKMFLFLAFAAALTGAHAYGNQENQPPQISDLSEAERSGEKIQKIIFMQDDDQFDIVSKVYELKYTKAADLAPFVKSAVIRFDPASTVGRLEDAALNRQLLIVSTAADMLSYVDEMVAKLDRPGIINDFGTVISGSGIAYGTYAPQYRSAESMRNAIVGAQISSGPLDSKIRLDRKTNLFYFKDTPSRVQQIKEKLQWLDQPLAMAVIELKIYEIRDSELQDLGIDYLAWKNGPGLNLFGAGYDFMDMSISESIFDQLAQSGADLGGSFATGVGGMYTAPAFDLSFVRILEQNGKATINSSASINVSNRSRDEFKVAFAPEYQNVVKNEDHQVSVTVGGDVAIEAVFRDVLIASQGSGVVNFNYALHGANVVERNPQGVEIMENTLVQSAVSLKIGQEKVLATYQKVSEVEQNIGVPFLCELPVLKYIFGTTTSSQQKSYYLVTATVRLPEQFTPIESGILTEFNELAQK